MIKMNEYRCYNCNNILCKATNGLDIEIICPKCRRINYPARTKIGLGLRGKDFSSKCINHHCPQCKRLLLRTIGYGYIELKCSAKKCNWIGTQNTLEIRKKIFNLIKVTIDKLQLQMNTYIVEDKPKIIDKLDIIEDGKDIVSKKPEVILEESEIKKSEVKPVDKKTKNKK